MSLPAVSLTSPILCSRLIRLTTRQRAWISVFTVVAAAALAPGVTGLNAQQHVPGVVFTGETAGVGSEGYVTLRWAPRVGGKTALDAVNAATLHEGLAGAFERFGTGSATQAVTDLPVTGKLTRNEAGAESFLWYVERAPELGGPITYQLQQAAQPDFADAVTRYQGPEQGSVLTGFAEGTYYFRVRALGPEGEPGPWLDTFVFEVEYADMRLVYSLMATGVIVFILTVGAILAGHRKTRGEQTA